MQIDLVILIIAGVWLFLLTIGFLFLLGFFNKLTRAGRELDAKRILERILGEESRRSEEVHKLAKELSRLEEEGYFHVQKVGLIRFNPFEEIGGDHSFSLAILDGRNTGLVITGLHTRERTRIYVKEINGGRSSLKLSSEEQKAIIKAQKG